MTQLYDFEQRATRWQSTELQYKTQLYDFEQRASTWQASEQQFKAQLSQFEQRSRSDEDWYSRLRAAVVDVRGTVDQVLVHHPERIRPL